jgi:hypothetical protein
VANFLGPNRFLKLYMGYYSFFVYCSFIRISLFKGNTTFILFENTKPIITNETGGLLSASGGHLLYTYILKQLATTPKERRAIEMTAALGASGATTAIAVFYAVHNRSTYTHPSNSHKLTLTHSTHSLTHSLTHSRSHF